MTIRIETLTISPTALYEPRVFSRGRWVRVTTQGGTGLTWYYAASITHLFQITADVPGGGAIVVCKFSSEGTGWVELPVGTVQFSIVPLRTGGTFTMDVEWSDDEVAPTVAPPGLRAGGVFPIGGGVFAVPNGQRDGVMFMIYNGSDVARTFSLSYYFRRGLDAGFGTSLTLGTVAAGALGYLRVGNIDSGAITGPTVGADWRIPGALPVNMTMTVVPGGTTGDVTISCGESLR